MSMLEPPPRFIKYMKVMLCDVIFVIFRLTGSLHVLQEMHLQYISVFCIFYVLIKGFLIVS